MTYEELNINRITVEFKDFLYRGVSEKVAVILIESQWNLKSEHLSQVLLGVLILIESQWNLKVVAVFHFDKQSAY